MANAQDILTWRGMNLVDTSGSKIGSIEEIYEDTDTGQPEWALVHTGLFGTKSTFVPLRDASQQGDSITVPYDKSLVKDAPGIEREGELSRDEEQRLYQHYGVEWGEFDYEREYESDRAPVGRDTSGPTTDDAMTRSEEELRVGTTERERGRARLRKYVVTEQVQQTVPVQREEVRIEREPITDANVGQATDGPAISEEEHEVVLHEEEVVTEKRTVPKERVRMDKETVVDEQTVSEEVRKEQIEADTGESRR